MKIFKRIQCKNVRENEMQSKYRETVRNVIEQTIVAKWVVFFSVQQQVIQCSKNRKLKCLNFHMNVKSKFTLLHL